MVSAPATPTITFSRTQVTTGRGGYMVSGASDGATQLQWSIANGALTGPAGAATTSLAGGLGLLLLTLTAVDAAGDSAATTLVLDVIAALPESSPLSAPDTVTRADLGVYVDVVTPATGISYHWQLTSGGRRPTRRANDRIDAALAAGNGSSVQVSCNSVNAAGDESMAAASATIAIVPPGLTLLAGCSAVRGRGGSATTARVGSLDAIWVDATRLRQRPDGAASRGASRPMAASFGRWPTGKGRRHQHHGRRREVPIFSFAGGSAIAGEIDASGLASELFVFDQGRASAKFSASSPRPPVARDGAVITTYDCETRNATIQGAITALEYSGGKLYIAGKDSGGAIFAMPVSATRATGALSRVSGDCSNSYSGPSGPTASSNVLYSSVAGMRHHGADFFVLIATASFFEDHRPKRHRLRPDHRDTGYLAVDSAGTVFVAEDLTVYEGHRHRHTDAHCRQWRPAPTLRPDQEPLRPSKTSRASCAATGATGLLWALDSDDANRALRLVTSRGASAQQTSVTTWCSRTRSIWA